MEKTTIHDHFDGSEHCRECSGHCKLIGSELFATELMRWIFEIWAYTDQKPHPLILKTIEKSGISIDRFIGRARQMARTNNWGNKNE